ncbi:MAG: hypothetical protein VCD00_03625 [Candidatus Hydrogenedentota bacterium]
MKETVRKVNHPVIVGAVMLAIAIAYFALLGQSGFQEPSAGIQYDVATYRDIDNVDTRFEEVGQLDPKMESPQTMAVSEDGRIFIAGENELVVFGDNDTEIDRFPISGKAKCMTVTPKNEIFIGFDDHVEVLAIDGTVKAVWDVIEPFPYITSIAVLDENVFVAAAGNKVVMQYDLDGNLIREIGKKNEDEDIPGIEVPSPYLDLAVNDEGDLWVVNPGLLGMERYRNDGSIVTSWYRATLQLEGFSGCCNPTHVAFMNDGRLVTAEKGLVRVKLYDVTDGEYQELVAGSKLFPREQSLKDIAVDKQDRILLLDPRINAVRIFDEKEKVDGQQS